MKNDLKICVSKKPRSDGVVNCRSVTLRDRLLTRLFGAKHKVLVLIPGDDVSTVSITSVVEGGAES